jgi:hypothetical protein
MEEITMMLRKVRYAIALRFASVLSALLLTWAVISGPLAFAGEHEDSILVLTSTNAVSANDVVVFKLQATGTPSLSLVDVLHTRGRGGASANAGAVQFRDEMGAVANFGSNTVTQLARHGDSIVVQGTINLVPNCVKPVSVALADEHLFVVGANCVESHGWPSGASIGEVVALSDPSAAQIAVGTSWAAVTLTSGSLLQLPLASDGALSGASNAVTLPSDADNTPLGAAFWGNILGFTPAHSPDSFAVVNQAGSIFPIPGPTPPYPTNAPCWVAKGPGSVWYTGNSPGLAISIFFTDGAGGVFYKSIALPGSPTDITVSRDKRWLAVIYTAGGAGHVAVFAIDRYGDLSPVATSSPIGVSAFSGVAFSQ